MDDLEEKIVFSDLDGVLNSTQSLKRNNENRLFYGKFSVMNPSLVAKAKMTYFGESLMFDPLLAAKVELSYFDYEKIQLLKKIALFTGSKIVIIGALNRLRLWILVEELLVEMGLPIAGKVSSPYGREWAILDYLNSHKVDKFIVLDDEKSWYDELLGHLIKTDNYYEGLTSEIADEAIEELGKVFTIKPHKNVAQFER